MPTKEELVNCFRDTINIINSDSILLNPTKDAMCNTEIILTKRYISTSSQDAADNIIVTESSSCHCKERSNCRFRYGLLLFIQSKNCPKVWCT